ncbi:dTDP-4-dehydrorhamnose 3,5-epimerase [Flavobacteriaceae bacterium]|nr:dTDP-4-dehydrorhamnose 3,5-epimerase [Flavobacteriaceae bacterium]
MKFTRTKIKDVIIIEPKVHGDDRGYFIESFREDKLADFLGININFSQDNESKSTFGVLRGLHYQLPPYAQTKLVRVIKGSVLDIAVDIRKGSPNFGEHVAVKLTEENKKQLLVPRGFAHGFIVLSDEAIFAYKVDNYYNPESDRGIAFDDQILNIDWKLPAKKMQLSQKDKQQLSFSEADYIDYNINLYE